MRRIIKIIKLCAISIFIIIVILIVLPFFIPMGFGSVGTKFVLSRDKPLSKKWGIELLAISNQTATIRIIKTDEVISANKGSHFKSRCYKRLYLNGVSSDTGEIELINYYSISLPAIKGVTY